MLKAVVFPRIRKKPCSHTIILCMRLDRVYRDLVNITATHSVLLQVWMRRYANLWSGWWDTAKIIQRFEKNCFSYAMIITYVLRNLVRFAQLKKREKHPWRNVTFSKLAGYFTKVTFLQGCFSRFLNCANGTKWWNASHVLFCLLGDADEIGIPKTNTWYFNGYDTDECFDKYFESPTEHRPPTCYLGFPCTKVRIKSHLSHACILSSTWHTFTVLVDSYVLLNF